MKLQITILILYIFNFSFGQVDDSLIRLKVLKKNVIGKEFTFGKWNQKGKTETKLTYLGSVKTKKGKIYKIINSTWIWGISARATNRILIYNNQNQYLGNYYITTSNDLPTELKNGYLIFKNSSKNCDEKIVTKVNFRNGIPSTFFRKCNNEFGDFYNFEG